MAFWCCILTSYNLVYGLNQFHISWLTLVLVRDEQFSGHKTVFNKPWYFSSDIPSLKMTFIMSANSSLTFLSTFSFSLKLRAAHIKLELHERFQSYYHKFFYVYLEARSPFLHSRQTLVEIQHRCYYQYHRHRRKTHLVHRTMRHRNHCTFQALYIQCFSC